MIAGWFAAGGMLIISDWAAVFFEKYRWRWLTKTGAMLCLIAAYTLSGGWQKSSWFGMGLIFSLGGDTSLLLPPRYFLAGLAAFFLAQLSYILAFHHPPAPLWINHLLSAGVLLIVALVAFRRVLAVLPAEKPRKTASMGNSPLHSGDQRNGIFCFGNSLESCLAIILPLTIILRYA